MYHVFVFGCEFITLLHPKQFFQSRPIGSLTCVNARKEAAISEVVFSIITFNVVLVIAIAMGGHDIEFSY